MAALTPEMQAIKEKMKAVWSAGDFGIIAKLIEAEGADFIKRLNIPKGAKVLDVACGTGNLAIPAARSGADACGIDIVADLIRQANERAASEKLNAKFEVGDAEALPFNDNEFDYVVTMFGAMFAPRPEVTASELVRVTKPGGTIAMANWTPQGFVGQFFKLGASYAPPPPVPPPILWGDEAMVKQRFGSRISNLNMRRWTFRQFIPMSINEAAVHFITYFGPTKTLYEMLDEPTRERFKNDLKNLWAQNNAATDGTLAFDSEYLEVVARK
ncbi:MAG: class I SAM-dependent methyltransferase [Chlorobi bacterium]|nr:class I SAM-dependent methyltransferase [Chlorobiota bacterium]MCI0715436.1 class I SAM-dependent methyltransferase [Chlorobiota bacterium]